MIARRWIIRGGVQGVGYRDWMVRTATRAGVRGWVRNRIDGAVEAVVAGDAEAITDLMRLCRRGPPLASVAAIDEEAADAPAEPGFRRAPTVAVG
jgi:acylphosphatase